MKTFGVVREENKKSTRNWVNNAITCPAVHYVPNEFSVNEYYFVSNPSNYTVKSNFLFRHGPFAFPGK
jgi:hypothetical protein